MNKYIFTNYNKQNIENLKIYLFLRLLETDTAPDSEMNIFIIKMYIKLVWSDLFDIEWTKISNTNINLKQIIFLKHHGCKNTGGGLDGRCCLKHDVASWWRDMSHERNLTV